MAYSAREARLHMLDELAEAVADLSRSVASLGEAYEQLDEHTGDELERALFAPAQHAYGLARRTHAGFAERHALPAPALAPGGSGAHASDPRVHIDRALAAAAAADGRIATLQDSLMPVEVGDAELRAALAEIRELIAPLPERGRALLRRVGR